MRPKQAPGEPGAEGRFAAVLHDRGGRVTAQRLAIHAVVRDLGRHASADEIRARVAARLPNVSLPTVYATLELFEELGIVRRARGGAGVTLFDPRTEPHAHVVCDRCGATSDLEASVDWDATLEAAERTGFDARGADLVVGGLCRRCARPA